jgi:hypothetical protein
MKYVIDKKNENLKLVNYNVKISGMRVKPINNVKGLTIKASKIVLVDSKLRDSYINQVIDKKLDKIVKFSLNVLSDEDASEEDGGIVLDELNRLQGVIMNKYKQYMIEEVYRNKLSKIIIVGEEFKRNYNQKVYMNYLSGFSYQEEMSSGRGR